MDNCLVIWNHGILFSAIKKGIILPVDELICFRTVGLNHQPVEAFCGKTWENHLYPCGFSIVVFDDTGTVAIIHCMYTFSCPATKWNAHLSINHSRCPSLIHVFLVTCFAFENYPLSSIFRSLLSHRFFGDAPESYVGLPFRPQRLARCVVNVGKLSPASETVGKTLR